MKCTGLKVIKLSPFQKEKKSRRFPSTCEYINIVITWTSVCPTSGVSSICDSILCHKHTGCCHIMLLIMNSLCNERAIPTLKCEILLTQTLRSVKVPSPFLHHASRTTLLLQKIQASHFFKNMEAAFMPFIISWAMVFLMPPWKLTSLRMKGMKWARRSSPTFIETYSPRCLQGRMVKKELD